MKRLFRFLIIASTLTIYSIFSEQAHAELRSPCVLTDSEKTMIAMLTRMRDSLHLDYPNTKECFVFAPHTILIRYKNGYAQVFGTGQAPVLDQKQDIFRDDQTIGELGEPDLSHRGTEHEKKIFGQLNEIWQSVDSPDDLSSEELARIDALVQELFATTPADEIERATYNVLGLRGNRYLKMIKELLSLSPDAEITFYEGYLDSQSSAMRTEDIPTDGEKQTVIQNLVRMRETQQNDKPYVFSLTVSEEIRKIDQAAYEVLRQNGMITETASPQTKSPE